MMDADKTVGSSPHESPWNVLCKNEILVNNILFSQNHMLREMLAGIIIFCYDRIPVILQPSSKSWKF